jgi:hypothetical protein
MTQQRRIIFSFDKDEIMPTFLGWGHGLKEENMCFFEIISSVKTQDGSRKEYIERALYKNKTVDVFLTFALKNEYYILEKGVVKVDNKECNIIDCRSYYSLQIGQYCYDNITVIKLPYNIFELSRMSANGASINTGLNASAATSIANVMTAPEISS